MADLFEWGHYKEQLEYLEQRGLTKFLIERLGIQLVANPDILRERGFKHPALDQVHRALLLPIVNVKGEVVDWQARLFYKPSFVDSPGPKLLHIADASSAKPPSVHFSPLANWDKLEYGQRVYICESVIKANLVASLGYHAIGIPGCWGYSKKGKLHWSLSELEWERLKPVLMMDSNVNPDNPKLARVAPKFSAMMDAEHDSDTGIILLPQSPDGTDWGIDDFYHEHGVDATRELLDSEAEPVVTDLGAALSQLNEEVVVIREISRFAELSTNFLMSRNDFENINFAARRAFDEEGKRVPVAKVWTQWPRRSEVLHVRYRPGEPKVVREEDDSYFNLWSGWGVSPASGSADWFTEWVEDAFPTDIERAYFLDWWAYQVQNPGVKLNTALMLVGPSGVGKGWMAAIAERIFGSDNTWKCNLSDLESRFNSGLGAAQILIIEEADVAGGVKVYNTLKDLITNEHIRYERKGVDAIKIENCLNIFLNSNHIGVLRLDEFDRRFAVLEITNQSIANDLRYWEPRWDWLREGGAAQIFNFLMTYSISQSFNPHGEAPWTQAKADMIETTHHPIDQWVTEHVLRGEELMVHGKDVCEKKDPAIAGFLMSAKELVWCYHEGRVEWNDIDRSESMRMVKALNDARVPVANSGKKIKWDGNSTKFYWLGNQGLEADYQHQLQNRQFFVALVASLRGSVASDGGAGNRDAKY